MFVITKVAWQSSMAVTNLSKLQTFTLPLMKLHTISFDKKMDLITRDKVARKDNSLKIIDNGNTSGAPLVLLYGWLFSKVKALQKYEKFYHDLGFDVLRIRLNALDILRPAKGSQVLASNILQFLNINYTESPILVHGFSVGAYAYSEALVQMNEFPEAHKNVQNRIVGHIFDSAVDVDGIPIGIPRASTDNKVLRKYMEHYIRWYLKANYMSATRHYIKGSNLFKSDPLLVPALMLYSNTDLIVPPETIEKSAEKWRTVYYKKFEKSPHVSHYLVHKKDYEEELLTFLERINLYNHRVRAVA